MGVPLKDIVPVEKIELEALSHKVLAVDAFNAIYQFLANIRQPDGSPLLDHKGRVTSHLKGLLNRNTAFLSKHIYPVYVFDGKPDELKKETIEQRNVVRQAAREEWKEAIEEGDLEKAQRKARESTKLTASEIESAKKLLSLLGLPVIDAPAEGEAQASYIVSRGDAWAVASQDYDVLLFGAPRLIRNLAISGRRRLPRSNVYVDVAIEYVELDKVLAAVQFTREELIDAALLMGTDYNEGYRGIGPKTAIRLIKEHKTFENAAKQKGLLIPPNLEQIRTLFARPPVSSDYRIEFSPPDVDGILSFLVGEHDFTEDGVKSALEKIISPGAAGKGDRLKRKKQHGYSGSETGGKDTEKQSQLDSFF